MEAYIPFFFTLLASQIDRLKVRLFQIIDAVLCACSWQRHIKERGLNAICSTVTWVIEFPFEGNNGK